MMLSAAEAGLSVKMMAAQAMITKLGWYKIATPHGLDYRQAPERHKLRHPAQI